MDQYGLTILDLVVNNETTAKKTSYVKSFILDSAAPGAGTVFGIIEILSSQSKIADLLTIIIAEIEKNYTASLAEALTPEARLERALQKTNLAISAFIETEHVTLNLSKVNIVVAALIGRQLIFTHVGSMATFLLHYVRKGEYRIYNILDLTRTPTLPPHPLKMFSQIITGSMRSADILVISTSNLLDYFSLDSVKKIITTAQSLEDSITEFKDLLNNLGSKNNFSLLVGTLAKITANEQVSERSTGTFDYQQAASRDSLRGLAHTEQQTEKLLAPSIVPEWRNLNGLFRRVWTVAGEKLREIVGTHAQKIVAQSRARIQTHLRHSSGRLATAGVSVNQLVRQSRLAPLLKISSGLFNRSILGRWYARLPGSSQRLFILSVGLSILLLGSIGWLTISNNREHRQEAFNQTMIAAETKKNEAEASLIYRDEDQARALLLEVKAMVGDLKPHSISEQTRVKLLMNDLAVQLGKLSRTVVLNDPIMLANFQNVAKNATFSPVVVPANNGVALQNTADNQFLRADLTSKAFNPFGSPLPSSITTASRHTDNEYIVLSTTDKKGFTFNVGSGATASLPISLSSLQSLIDSASFNDRLYILDAAGNAIYRSAAPAPTYGALQSWLKDTIDITHATSLAVDGAVYLTFDDGRVKKFLNGHEASFSLASIEDPLHHPTKIRIIEGRPEIYILDPDSHRLIVFGPNGQLIIQYTSPLFTELKDFIVLVQQKRIYMLNGSAVYGIAASHLQ